MKRSVMMAVTLAMMLPAGTALAQEIENREAGIKFNEARSLFQQGKYEEAKALLIESVKLEPGNVRALYLLGTTYYRLREPEQAIAQYEAAINFNPNYYVAYSAMGEVYLNALNDPAKAEEYYTKAGEISEAVGQPYARAFLNLGKILFDQERWDEAFMAYGKVAQYEPTNENAYMLMGRIQVEKGEYDNAMMYFSQAATLKPTWYEPYFFQANVLNRIGQYQGAIEQADAALERMPGFGGALLEKGTALKGLQKWDEAIKVLEEAKKDAQWRQSAEYLIETIKNRDAYVNIPPDTTRIPPTL